MNGTEKQTIKTTRRVMNNKFDELAKGLAQSVTRRGALKKFGVGLVGLALASLGLATKAHAGRGCITASDCPAHSGGAYVYACVNGRCVKVLPPR